MSKPFTIDIVCTGRGAHDSLTLAVFREGEAPPRDGDGFDTSPRLRQGPPGWIWVLPASSGRLRIVTSTCTPPVMEMPPDVVQASMRPSFSFSDRSGPHHNSWTLRCTRGCHYNWERRPKAFGEILDRARRLSSRVVRDELDLSKAV